MVVPNVDLLTSLGLIKNNDELVALTSHKIESFGDLISASNSEPGLLKPVLNRYIDWFNRIVVPIAVRNALTI